MNKQFKIKNRKKRKYIKKSSPVSELSLTKSWLIKLMPYIIMAVGFVTTLAITPVQTLQPITIDPITIQPLSFDLTKPASIIESILRIFLELAAFSSSMQAQLSHQLGEGFSFISAITMQGLTTILHIISVAFSAIAFAATMIGKGIVTIVLTLVHIVTIAMNALLHFLIEVTETVLTAIEIIIKAIYHSLTIAAIKTMQWLDAAWYFLMTPVRALIAFYIQIKPYLDFVLNNFKDSATYLKESMSILFSIASTSRP